MKKNLPMGVPLRYGHGNSIGRCCLVVAYDVWVLSLKVGSLFGKYGVALAALGPTGSALDNGGRLWLRMPVLNEDLKLEPVFYTGRLRRFVPTARSRILDNDGDIARFNTNSTGYRSNRTHT
jgi:hypothetical protein